MNPWRTLKKLILCTILALVTAGPPAGAAAEPYWAIPILLENLGATRIDNGAIFHKYVFTFGAATDTTYFLGNGVNKASIQNGSADCQFQWVGDPDDTIDDGPFWSGSIANPMAGLPRVIFPLTDLAAGTAHDYESDAVCRAVRIVGDGSTGTVDVIVTKVSR